MTLIYVCKTARTLSIGSLISGAFLLSACGTGSDALDDAASRPNSFPPVQNALDDFTSTRTGDTSNSPDLLPSGQVRVTMELPALDAPEGEETRRNLRIVEPDSVTVYETDQTLSVLGFSDTSVRRDEDNFPIITFRDGLPLGPDVIIEATYGSITLRALATDADRDVKVNPFSEFLVEQTLGGYTSIQFDDVMDCVNDVGSTLCLNKYVWSTLSDQIHDFEIDIPLTVDTQGALSYLSGRGDLTSYLSSMADYALLGANRSGTITASSADYNTVLWIAELGQTFRESSISGSGQWGVRTAAEKTVSDGNGTGYFYPGLTLTNFSLFNINVTSLASDIPYDRSVLIQTASDDFFERSNWEINTHSTAPGAATLEDDARLLAGRSMYQSITGQGSSETIGWTRNPYYLDALAAGSTDEPDRLISSYFTAGKAIELVSRNRKLKRDKLLENHYQSVLEINLLQEEGFQVGTLDGLDYNVVYLSTQMDGSGTDAFVIESGVGTWDISGQTVTQVMDTRSVRRDSDGNVTTQTPADSPGLRDASWLVSERPSRVFITGEGQQQQSLGRLSLDRDSFSNSDAKPQVGIGASTPDGALLAFNLDVGTIGRGILIAGQEANTSPPSSGDYKVQGVGMAMSADTNRLAHFNNATLSIQSNSTAELTQRTLEVTHDVVGENVSEPDAVNPGDVTLAYSASTTGTASFTSGDLVFEGFFTEDQSQFYLQVRDVAAPEELLGMVLATRIPD